MRCKYCDTILTNAEARNKDRETGEYVFICTQCYLDTLEDLCLLNEEKLGDEQ